MQGCDDAPKMHPVREGGGIHFASLPDPVFWGGLSRLGPPHAIALLAGKSVVLAGNSTGLAGKSAVPLNGNYSQLTVGPLVY